MRPRDSLPGSYFEDMFAADPDPWSLASSPYEAAKYDQTIAALGDRIYDRVLEIGCAGGVLTKRLATRARLLLAYDISPTAVRRARARCCSLTHVYIATLAFPDTVPAGSFDLVVLSEVAYYWSAADLGRAADYIRRALAQSGHVLLVHWTGDTDYPQSGDDAVTQLHDLLVSDITVEKADRFAEYRLDLWGRR